MAFKIPSMSESREFLGALFKFLFPKSNAGSRRSYHGKRITFVAGAVTQLHAHIDSVQQDVMPDTASDGKASKRWGDIFRVARRSATGSTGALALRVYGDSGASQPALSTLKHPSSATTYKLPNIANVPATGYVDVNVSATSTGAITNLDVGQILEFDAPNANIRTRAVVVKKFTGGYDDEAYGSYRARYLETMGSRSSGGNQNDYVLWALEIPGINNAYAYCNRSGLGTVDVVLLKAGVGTARILTVGEVATATAYLKAKAPGHLGVPGVTSLRVLTVVDDPQVVEVRVASDGAAVNAFDWDDSLGYTALAYTPGTKELQFAGGLLPPSLAAGHRLIPRGVASTQDGRQIVVEAISGVDKVILSAAPFNNIANTDQIYSGGPLVDPIRNAIIAHMSGDAVYLANGAIPTAGSTLSSLVGLEKLADPIGPANPAGAYGTWSGGLILPMLSHIAMSKAGVRKFSAVLPAADYEATDYAYPLNNQIGLISPSAVYVRTI